MQHTSHILMIKPVQFAFNAETAVNNSFQINSLSADIQKNALQEFENLVQILDNNNVDVTVFEDSHYPHTPDSIFPNNWISFHNDGSLILYPMFAENRRLERNEELVKLIKEKFIVNQIYDLSRYEKQNQFLEGTGSMVLDRDHKIAYACLSQRTHLSVLQKFCETAGFHSISFTAKDIQGQPIYHTNVMMSIADEYVIICLDCIENKTERANLIQSFQNTEKEIIEISFSQMNCFAGNMLQIHNNSGNKFIVMSSKAYHSLSSEQILKIEKYNRILHSGITTIETNGGGSVRCMMAEIFLSKKH